MIQADIRKLPSEAQGWILDDFDNDMVRRRAGLGRYAMRPAREHLNKSRFHRSDARNPLIIISEKCGA